MSERPGEPESAREGWLAYCCDLLKIAEERGHRDEVKMGLTVGVGDIRRLRALLEGPPSEPHADGMSSAARELAIAHSAWEVERCTFMAQQYRRTGVEDQADQREREASMWREVKAFLSTPPSDDTRSSVQLTRRDIQRLQSWAYGLREWVAEEGFPEDEAEWWGPDDDQLISKLNSLQAEDSAPTTGKDGEHG